MATFFPCARRPRFSGKKEGDVSEVMEAGSTLYAVRRSPARPTVKISPARAPSQAQQRSGAQEAFARRTFIAIAWTSKRQMQRPRYREAARQCLHLDA
jgi:hypothetical protein